MLISRSIGESVATAVQTHEVVIEIGGMAVCVRTESAEFRRILEERYVGYVSPATRPGSAGQRKDCFQLDVELLPQSENRGDEDVRVRREGGCWAMTRGDFRAEWEPDKRQGWVRQTANPYAIDSVLRILHTLLLAEEGGFLLHGASAIRNGKAFLLSGKSGAGKTTISRLAPRDVTLLTDEISYVRRAAHGPDGRGRPSPHNQGSYVAYGTPFAGELAKVGENVSAPIAGLYFLVQARENRVEPLLAAEALSLLMQNILFFAADETLVRQVFETVGDFLAQVPAYRLAFKPEARVWELMR